MPVYQQHPVGFPAEPRVATTAETGSRASQLLRNPEVQRLARGLWVVRREPLTLTERALLLQKHLAGPDSGLLVSGVSALDLMRIPVGGTEPWVEAALGRGRSAPAPSRGGARNAEFATVERRVELLWTTHRIQSQQDGVRIAESRGFPSLAGPWETQIAHPLEVLARLSPVLAQWRLTACLDALLSTRFVVTGTWTPVTFSRAHVQEHLDKLPAGSRGARRMHRAWQDARSSCWSPAETLTRLLAVRNGLPEPALNHPVTVDGRTFVLDLAWRDARVAVEFNGAVHAREAAQYRDEMHRLSLLRDAGWDVSVLTWDDLRSPARRDTWVNRVRRGLSWRRSTPPHNDAAPSLPPSPPLAPCKN